ncbi:MAG TPA: alpha/beta fold hydrolase [Thermoanaerobaculia bacterium]|jgi:predicted alpha/beta-fold hydrolase|nr:alpha/beta fold hydrolase [Thermoanaerobaculia bacterium]
MSLLGHYWTIAPRLHHGLRPLPAPEARAWETSLVDPVTGRVPVTGWLRERPGSGSPGGEELVLLVHGLGGSTESHYMVRAAHAADAAGLSCLRLNLRGCDRRSHDFFHAGLTADLHAALASEELRGYRRIYVVGYSLGGHVALRLATEDVDPRVAGVAAVCAPLDLSLSQRAIDAPVRWLYRRYLMSSLIDIFVAVAARRPQALTAGEAARIRTIREWDDRVVAPRHGFADADDYYARASVAPRLGELRVPALLVNSEGDPMVPARPVRAVLRPAPRLEVRWVAGGGHVSFPRSLNIGLDKALEDGLGVDAQVLGWLRRQPQESGR